jgi:hypothetical protein
MKSLTLAGLGIAVLLTGAPFALAHDTGHESRTPADCEKLPGTAAKGERGECLKCVARPQKHHFHPDNPVGKRCRPDDGKP